MDNNLEAVRKYFGSRESQWGYRYLLKGVRHFGYYPEKENSRISISKAQENLTKMVGESLGLSPGSRVLDAGFGEGVVAIYLALNFGYKVTGIDIMKENIPVAERRALRSGTHIDFIAGDYSHTNFPDNYFDGIYTVETLVHTSNLEKTLAEFMRILKPGGVLVNFEYFLEDKLSNGEEKIWHSIYQGGAMMDAFNKFRIGSAIQFWKDTGFQNINVQDITSHVIPFIRKLRNLAKLPYYFLRVFGKEKRFINIYTGFNLFPIRHGCHYINHAIL